MMLIKYRHTDGAIRGTWSTDLESLLRHQMQGDDPAHGYLMQAEDIDVGLVSDRYYVTGERLTPKTALTLTADPTMFPADGRTVCRVTVTPFVPCTLLVDGQPLALTPGDSVLELTAQAAHTFFIALDPMVTAWAEPIAVEAADAAR